MHLPLVFVAQGVATRTQAPPLLEFAVMCMTITALLAVSYRYLVRYRFIGTLLNGRRTKAADTETRNRLAT